MTALAHDSLTARGARRRESLLAATLRLIVREGPGGVTLRTVATEAAASHGLAVYYFGTREELIRGAFQFVADRNIAALEKAWQSIAQRPTAAQVALVIARHVAAQMVADREMGITIMELHLAAARFPALRESVRVWGHEYRRISEATFRGLGSTAPAEDSALLTNLINGLVLGQLAAPRKGFENSVLRPMIEGFLGSITARASTK